MSKAALYTRCINCGRTLTDEHGVGQAAHFDSELPGAQMKGSATWARCSECYAIAKAVNTSGAEISINIKIKEKK